VPWRDEAQENSNKLVDHWNVGIDKTGGREAGRMRARVEGEVVEARRLREYFKAEVQIRRRFHRRYDAIEYSSNASSSLSTTPRVLWDRDIQIMLISIRLDLIGLNFGQ
jgi:hypothetical protein